MSNSHENHEPHEVSRPEQAVERALARVAPVPARIDRDRLMFLAGVASASSEPQPPTSDVQIPERHRGRSPQHRSTTSGSAWQWPAATAALAATSLALA